MTKSRRETQDVTSNLKNKLVVLDQLSQQQASTLPAADAAVGGERQAAGGRRPDQLLAEGVSASSIQKMGMGKDSTGFQLGSGKECATWALME